MTNVCVAGYSIYSPLGDCQKTYNRICLKEHLFSNYLKSSEKLLASQFTKSQINTLNPRISRFDNIASRALLDLKDSTQSLKGRGLLILASTKGNLDYLEKNEAKISLHQSAKILADQVGIDDSLVISNACSSGVIAIITAKRYLDSELYKYCIVVGAEVLSDFIISGFQCLNGLSKEPCKPFDIDRSGLTLGEGAAAILLTVSPKVSGQISISGGAMSNDANHITGPSKTGVALADAISRAMKEAKIDSSMVNFISAHGTGTIYNDEMESKAFNLAGLSSVPLCSLKGSLGHTLGASGVLETALCIHSLKKQNSLPTLGFSKLGVPKKLNVCTKSEPLRMDYLLKTASGFGGTNAAIIINR